MISLTRREFDSVSAALTDAWLDARRRERLERLGLRPEKPQAKTKKAETRAAEPAIQH